MGEIIVDPRQGSGEFAKLFERFSIKVYEEYLDSADFAFVGSGPTGDVTIGVERKALADFLSCMDDNRFVGFQLDKLLKSYNYVVMVIEGAYRPDDKGFIEVLWQLPGKDLYIWKKLYSGKKTVLYSQLAAHLNTLRLKAGTPNAGFLVMQTSDKLHTTHEVAHLYRWFQKPWEEHQSHIGFYDPASVFRAKSSFERRVVMQLDGVGYDRSKIIEDAFPGVKDVTSSMEQIMLATEKDWASIEGIGKTTAEKIYRQLHGRNEPKEPKKTRKKKDA